MIGLLIRKELLANLLTGRLTAAFIATVVLAVGVTVVASLDYSARSQAYRSARQQTEEALRNATIYAQVEPDVHLPPPPLSIFCLGVEAWVGNRLLIRGNGAKDPTPTGSCRSPPLPHPLPNERTLSCHPNTPCHRKSVQF